jgi:hypothetical protein
MNSPDIARINYMIATYGAKRPDEKRNQELSEYVLAIECKHLQRIFAAKKQQQIPNLITQITIIRPPIPEDKKDLQYPHYYPSSSSSLENIDIEGVPVKFVEYQGENKHHSYDQYCEGYQAYPDFDYFFVMEDDYCMDDLAIDFDQEFVDLYRQKFEKGTGFLCQWFVPSPLHAAISNGLISKQSFQLLGNDAVKAFFETTQYDIGQLKFSAMFTRFSVEHQDTSKEHKMTFFVTGAKCIETFVCRTDNAANPPIRKRVIITCQEADMDHDYSTQYTPEQLWDHLLCNETTLIPFEDRKQDEEKVKRRYIFTTRMY